MFRIAQRGVQLILVIAVASAACTTTSLTAPNGTVVKCQITLTGPQASLAAEGGNGAVAIAAAPECAWTATTQTAWITELTPTSGQGPGSIAFKTAVNPAAAPRQGDISVNGTAVRIAQSPAPCAYDVTPASTSVGANGGSGSAAVATIAGCTWSAVSEAPWITVTSARDNTGPGSVTFDAAANPGVARTGSIAIAGKTVTVSQPAPACNFVLTPPTQTIAAAGGNGQVTVAAGAICTWTATTNVPWITVTAGATGTANGVVSFVVAANPGASRTGQITVGGETVTINQPAVPTPCTYSINATNQSFTDTGGSGSVAVTTQAGCAWTASSNASWLVVTSGASGTGPGSVTFTVAPNTSGARNGALVVAGQTFSVHQDQVVCSYSINPSAQTVSNTAGNGTSIAVTTFSPCGWAAGSNSPPWLSVTSGPGGTGSGTVTWTFADNTGPSRVGTMTIAGQTFTATQNACSYNITPTTLSGVPNIGTNINLVTVTTVPAAGCSVAWSATANVAWLTITAPGPGTGGGTVEYTVAANATGLARTGTITIAGRTFTVDQLP